MARLIETLDPALREEVESSFPADLVTAYEDGLRGVNRLEHTRRIIPVEAGFTETNLDHVNGMLEMLHELKQYKHLSEEVNFREVAYMIALHDAGEIIVGDAPPFGAEREGLIWSRRKRQEPIMAKRFVLSQISDEEKRKEMTTLYDRYIDQDPKDKEALLARLIDKAQATTRTNTAHVYNQRERGKLNVNFAQLEHVENSTSILVGAGLNLYRAVSPLAGNEVRDFVIGELRRLKPIGFAAVAQAKISDIRMAMRPRK